MIICSDRLTNAASLEEWIDSTIDDCEVYRLHARFDNGSDLSTTSLTDSEF